MSQLLRRLQYRPLLVLLIDETASDKAAVSLCLSLESLVEHCGHATDGAGTVEVDVVPAAHQAT